MPGTVFPEDCGEDIEAGLRAMLASGEYMLDYWEGEFEHHSGDPTLVMPADKTAYYLRPRVDNEVDNAWPVHGTWGGKCIFHMDTGCRLKFEARPLNCRMLKPRERRGAECTIDGVPKEDCIAAWIPHNDLIERVLNELREA